MQHQILCCCFCANTTYILAIIHICLERLKFPKAVPGYNTNNCVPFLQIQRQTGLEGRGLPVTATLTINSFTPVLLIFFSLPRLNRQQLKLNKEQQSFGHNFVYKGHALSYYLRPLPRDVRPTDIRHCSDFNDSPCNATNISPQ